MMDFQSAMETFAEAWVAANAGQQSQALALTRAANAAAVVAAANANAKSPQSLDMAVKKEHSLSPPHLSGVGGVASGEEHLTSSRRGSLQGVQEKLNQLQMQHHHQQQQQQHQHQQQQQQHQQQQQGAGGGESAASSAGRRSAESSPTAQPQHGQSSSSTVEGPVAATLSSSAASSQNASLAATPKSDREREREREDQQRTGSISCLPPAALGMAVGHVQQAQQQAEKLLSHPALESRRDFDVSKVNRK
ncbi:uncharacterized protein Dwil_GK27975 [Drosophila willistoni]|uniref:Uncharacterized protein n=1 Tax=Drosophila willistoni TaxID=7260 RepID=A0A0Q9WZC1_DROWI|nr:uncharacterized protein Dwil_GK27975 [Drosophila willistoni]